MAGEVVSIRGQARAMRSIAEELRQTANNFEQSATKLDNVADGADVTDEGAYRVYLNEDRTVAVTIWSRSGEITYATRPDSSYMWDPAERLEAS